MPVMVVQVIRPDVPGTLEWKIQRLHNPSDGKITSLVEIDRRRKHICIGARNDISMNAKMQNTLYLSNTMNVQG